VTEIDSDFEAFKDDCKYVNSFYFDTRYPASFQSIDIEEARQCITATDKIMDFVLKTENNDS
jgi:HEPN domain-containing protein